MYYLNNFPEPFVKNGEPDFAIIFGEDSRQFFLTTGCPLTIRDREDMQFADITDAFGVIELAFLLGRSFSPSVALWGGRHAFSANLVRVDRFIEREVKGRHLILIGSGKVNIVFKELEEKCRDQLRVAFKYNEADAIVALQSMRREMYHEANFGDVGFVHIAENPDTGKAVLFLAGYHGKGTYAACIALAKKLEEIRRKSPCNNTVACIVKSVRGGRLGRFFDDVEILDIIHATETTSDVEREHRDHLEKLLKRQKETLYRLQEQKAIYAPGEVPIHIINNIKHVEEEIDRIEKELKGLPS